MLDRGGATLGKVCMRVDQRLVFGITVLRLTHGATNCSKVRKARILTTNATVSESMRSMTLFVLFCFGEFKAATDPARKTSHFIMSRLASQDIRVRRRSRANGPNSERTGPTILEHAARPLGNNDRSILSIVDMGPSDMLAWCHNRFHVPRNTACTTYSKLKLKTHAQPMVPFGWSHGAYVKKGESWYLYGACVGLDALSDKHFSQ